MSRPLARTDAQIVPRPLEEVIRQVARLFQRRDLSYSQTAYVVKEARKRLGLAPEKKARKLPDIVSWSEAESIVAAAYQRDPVGGLVVKTLWFTMVRVGELVALRVGDLRLDEGYAKICSGKGGKDRLVVLPQTLSQELRSYVGKRRRGAVFLSQRGKAFSARRVEQIVGDAARAAKVDQGVTPHTLRRSMATALLNRGVREEAVSTLLGHESTETTRAAYARLSIQSLAEEVGRAVTA